MPRGSFFHRIDVAEGFSDDCEELIQRWLKTESFTFDTFCQIWKDMQFGLVYHGRTCGSEVAELSEELIQIAKHYMVVSTTNYEESVAGMFLVYALLNLQPYRRFASLRLVPQDLPAIKRIESVARQHKRYDVLYILGSLLIEGPVQYHAAAREYGIEFSIRKYLEGCSVIDRQGVRPRGVFYRQTDELDLLRELRVITKRYAEAKEAVPGSNHALNYVNHKFPEELDASLKRIIDGARSVHLDEDEETTSKTIKQKAMRMSVDGLKHLQSAVTKPTQQSPIKRSPVNDQKPLADRHCSPKKVVTSLARCNLSEISPKLKRKRKSSDSSQKSATPPHETENDSPLDLSEDITLDNFDKEKPNKTQLAQETEVSISIDSLPEFIKEEQGGKIIEIEFIDKMEPETKEGKNVESEQLVSNNSVTVSNLDYGAGTSTGTCNANVQWKPIPVLLNTQKKITGPLLTGRIKQKQIVKSKLERLGILEVATSKDDVKSAKKKVKKMKKTLK